MAGTTSADALLSVYPDQVQRLAHEARGCIARWLPDASEKVDVPSRLIAYAHGPGYKGAVCTLILSKTGIKLGLVGGATLPDPHSLLAGSGKVHRHVQLSQPADLHQPGLQELVRESSAACRKRLGEPRGRPKARA